MELILHRVNSVKELNKIKSCYGVEVDLRDDFDGNVLMQHDPFKGGELFEDYLRNYHHGTIILNIKSERIEYKVLELLKKYRINNFFFLDSSFPMIYNLSKSGENRIAIRISEYESIENAKMMAGRVKWIWLDCFSRCPINNQEFIALKDMGYKMCLVSPELQNHFNKIDELKKYLKEEKIVVDAICTKSFTADKWTKSDIPCR